MELTTLFALLLAMTRPWLRGGQRGDAPGGNVVVSYRRLTEAGDVRITEGGDTRVTEEAP